MGLKAFNRQNSLEFSHYWYRKENFSANSWSPVRPFYKNIFHDRCNTIHGHPDAFYFWDGLIFIHFVMSKNFWITRTVNGKAKDEKLLSKVKIKNKTRPKH